MVRLVHSTLRFCMKKIVKYVRCILSSGFVTTSTNLSHLKRPSTTRRKKEHADKQAYLHKPFGKCHLSNLINKVRYVP